MPFRSAHQSDIPTSDPSRSDSRSRHLVEVVALVAEFGDIRQDKESMGESAGNQKLLLVLFRQNLAMPFAVSRRARCLSDRLKKCIRPLRIEHLIAGHYRYQVLRLRQINDVMRPTGNHVHGFDFVAGDFEFYRFAGVDVALLDQAVALDHDEKLPLAVVPVLALGNTGLGDID